jgi:hypothetical protein
MSKTNNMSKSKKTVIEKDVKNEDVKDVKNEDVKDVKDVKNEDDKDVILDVDVLTTVFKKVNTFKRQKDGPANVATDNIGAIINVMKAKNYIIKYVHDVMDLKHFKVSNVHYPFVTILEVLGTYIVRSSCKYSEQNAKTANLYEINLEHVQRGIRENKDMGYFIQKCSDNYVSREMNYVSTFFTEEKEIRRLLETRSVPSSNYTLSFDALNFVCHILYYTMNEITKTCCYFSNYGNKQSIQFKNYKHAVKIYFSGELFSLIDMRLSEVETLLLNKKKGADEEEVVVSEEVNEVANN